MEKDVTESIKKIIDYCADAEDHQVSSFRSQCIRVHLIIILILDWKAAAAAHSVSENCYLKLRFIFDENCSL